MYCYKALQSTNKTARQELCSGIKYCLKAANNGRGKEKLPEILST